MCATRLVQTLVAVALGAIGPAAQSGPGPGPLSIPPMANATRIADLDYQAGECEVDRSGRSMTCVFQQVLLGPDPARPGTCTITTSAYQQTFRWLSATRWVSNAGPDGPCGVVTVTTLRQESGGLYTMDTRKVVTNKSVSSVCRQFDETPETLNSRMLRRPLPCTFVEPLALMPLSIR